jgi:hypothetical protein
MLSVSRLWSINGRTINEYEAGGGINPTLPPDLGCHTGKPETVITVIENMH